MARRSTRSKKRSHRGGGRHYRTRRNGGGVLDDVSSWGSNMWNRVSSSLGYGTAAAAASPEFSPEYDAPSFVPSMEAPAAEAAFVQQEEEGVSAAAPYNMGGRKRRRTMRGMMRGRMRGGAFMNSLTNIGMASRISGIPTARAHSWVGGGGDDGWQGPFVGGTTHCRALGRRRRRH